MNKKIFYLHYILTFLNDEYEIYNSIDETNCSKSILGISSDAYYKVHSDCYQLIYRQNYCFIRSLKDNSCLDVIKKKSGWKNLLKIIIIKFF